MFMLEPAVATSPITLSRKALTGSRSNTFFKAPGMVA